MNCQNCGAAMTPVGGRAYFRCGHCGSFEFPEKTEEGITLLGEATDYACPVCAKSLKKAALHGYTIFYCDECRGFLTTNPDFTAILAHRREESLHMSPVPRPIGPDELQRRVPCPGCKKKMDTHPYGGGGNVVVDTCYRCRLIWFDAGEFDALARHRPNSGVKERLQAPLIPQSSGLSKEPASGWRFGDGDASGTSLWDVLARLF